MTDALTLLCLASLMLVILVIRLCPKPLWLLPMLLYIGVGVALNALQLPNTAPVLAESFLPLLRLLAEAGLVMLLFQAGLSANLKELKAQLPLALRIWLSNVVLAAACGYLCARYLLHYDLLTSAFIAVALTATSVGVPVAIWSANGQLRSKLGNLLLEIAELDDISTIVLMAMLVALTPWLLNSGDSTAAADILLQMAGMMLGFIALALLFSRVIEPRLTRLLARFAHAHEQVLFVVATSLVLAAMSEFAGLSLAIGAFIAGLAFSRDRAIGREQAALQFVSESLTPFFFIGLGLQLSLQQAAPALLPALALTLAAIAGKVAGVALPMWRTFGATSALTVGVSMVPRSEVAMIVMQKGLALGVASEAFMAMLWVVLLTVLFTALLAPWQLSKVPPPPS